MSIQKIIQESIAGNPLEMKEALAEELRNRVAEALAAKMEEVEQIDEGLDFQNKTLRSGETTTHIYHNGKHAGTISKHFTRSNPNGSHRIQYNSDAIPAGSKGFHAHEGLPSHEAAKKLVAKHFNVKEEVEDLDEVSRKTLASYVKKAAGVDQHNTLPNAMRDRATAAAIGDKEWYKQSGRTADKRSKGIQKAADRLAKEEVEQIDEISIELAKRLKDKSKARGDSFRNKAGIVSGTADYSMQQARKNWNRADKAANYIKKKQEKEGSN